MAGKLSEANEKLLELTVRVIRSLEDAAYGPAPDSPLGAGVGSHVRHIHDHYALFLEGAASGAIDYERRERNARIERDREYAVHRLSRLVAALQALAVRGDAAVRVSSQCGSEPAWCGSTIARELEYLAMHDVHHHALIATILRTRGITVPDGFGVAPSTLRYLQHQ